MCDYEGVDGDVKIVLLKKIEKKLFLHIAQMFLSYCNDFV